MEPRSFGLGPAERVLAAGAVEPSERTLAWVRLAAVDSVGCALEDDVVDARPWDDGAMTAAVGEFIERRIRA